MSKRVAIIQSNYVPWKGYFDILRHVDEFVLYDDVQFTKNDWRNRNRIKTASGVRWLTIPVKTSGRFGQRICDTEVASTSWGAAHAKRLKQSYGKAPFFDQFWPRFEPLFESEEISLSRINRRFIEAVCAALHVKTNISWSMDYPVSEGKTTRLVDICLRAGATEYVSGPSAAAYLDRSAFDEAGISLHFADYSEYPIYPQMHGQFVHEVSILDLIFNMGCRTMEFMKERI